jgi:hypothetical protein
MSTRPYRTIIRSLRFTSEEWEKAAVKIAGRDFSSTVRALLLDGPIPEPKQTVRREIVRKRMTEAEARHVQQIAWLGNNLNQIARAANQGSDPVQTIAALASLEREIRRLTDAR